MHELNKLVKKMGEEAFFSVVVGLGCAAGATIGTIFGNVALSVGLGVAFGAAIAALILYEYRRQRSSKADDSPDR